MNTDQHPFIFRAAMSDVQDGKGLALRIGRGMRARPWIFLCFGAVALFLGAARGIAQEPNKNVESKIVDLSLLVATDMPCTWPASNWPMFQISHYRRIGPLSAYNSDLLMMDGNTGT